MNLDDLSSITSIENINFIINENYKEYDNIER